MTNTTYTHPAKAKGPTYKETVNGIRLVQPGETVMLAHDEGTQLVDNGRKTKKGGNTEKLGTNAELVELRGKSIAVITEDMPALDDAELAELLKLEQSADAPRVTLITAIEQLQLKRAAEGQ